MSTISIIIPSYRQPQFLGRAIESCLEQDHQFLEVIVVDDRSRDASLGLALSYAAIDHRVKVVECNENGGLGKARNIGIAHATGEYLCFLDSDDYLLDRSLSARLAAFPAAVAEHGDGVVGVYGDWQHVAESIDHPTVRAPRAVMPVVDASTYSGENVFICSAPVVRRDAVVEAGGFPEGLRMLEDFGLWAKMIASGAVFVPVHHVVSTYRQRPNSMLRGDRLVVMADHVQVINEWMANAGTPLADGGAMAAWLDDQNPFSFGRMSWNVPSVLGSFGGEPGANAVRSHEPIAGAPATSTVDDFMTHAVATGLDNPPEVWPGNSPVEPAMLVMIRSLEHSLQAVGIAQNFGTESITIGMFADDPTDWSITWPLALAGHLVRPMSDIAGLSTEGVVIDLSEPDHQFAETNGLALSGAKLIWPEESHRAGALVHVSSNLGEYPALDAWISTALHALAELGLEPRLVADPSVRSGLGGYRSEILSIDTLRSASIVVTSSGSHVGLVEELAPVVIFDPSNPVGEHARTRAELLASINAAI